MVEWRTSSPGRKPGENVRVEAYAGYKGEETPRAFSVDGRRLEVREICQRWYSERHSFFKLEADDGHRYVLRYDLEALTWELVMREQAQRIG
ncbi:MAG TPA: hypothetical protein VGQ60_04690 [Nitrospiraceae bacterium]|jgi:hypothetical protein|nr:hypothetical protein [Nitrospiraceae bacterium]